MMRTLLGLVVLALAMLLALAEMESLANPAALPAPWYAHVLWAMVILLMTAASVRLLSAGILGRLVRGRGLTPEPRR